MTDPRSPARRWPRRAAVLAILGGLIAQCQATASAQTPATPPVVPPASPCPDAPFESAQSCSDRPLNAKAYLPLQASTGLAWESDHYALKPAQLGVAYDAPLVRGGVGPYTAHIVGALPKGIYIDATGHLFGTPTEAGSFVFLLVIRDSLPQASELTLPFEIRVAPSTPASPHEPPPLHKSGRRWPPPLPTRVAPSPSPAA